MTSPGRRSRRMDMAVFCTDGVVNSPHPRRRFAPGSREKPSRNALRWSPCGVRRRNAACTLRRGTTSLSSSPPDCPACRGRSSTPRRRSRSGLVAVRPRRRSGTPKRYVAHSTDRARGSSFTPCRLHARSGGRELGAVFFSTLYSPFPRAMRPSMSNRCGSLLAHKISPPEPVEAEGGDELWRLARGDELGHRLARDGAGLEPVRAPAHVHEEALHGCYAHDGRKVRRHVAETRPLA